LNPTGDINVDCQNLCPYGYFGDGKSTTCLKCPDTVFNHEYGDPFTSYGVTFSPGLTDANSCVPRYSQQPNPTGHIMALPDAMLVASLPGGVIQGAVPLGDCVTTCPADKYCINQFQASEADENIGTCHTAVLDPAAPTYTGPKLYYKLPPSELIAAASTGDVKAKIKSSGIYAECSLATYGAAVVESIGRSPFPEDVEQPETFARWNEVDCDDKDKCKVKCDALATCWGFIYHPAKGFAIRGGEMHLGYRTFFVSPDGALASGPAVFAKAIKP
jgi:hypothetical protein